MMIRKQRPETTLTDTSLEDDEGEDFNNYNLPSSYVVDLSAAVRLAWVGEISREMLEKYVTPLVEEQ